MIENGVVIYGPRKTGVLKHIGCAEHANGMRTASLAVFKPQPRVFHGTPVFTTSRQDLKYNLLRLFSAEFKLSTRLRSIPQHPVILFPT